MTQENFAWTGVNCQELGNLAGINLKDNLVLKGSEYIASTYICNITAKVWVLSLLLANRKRL